jgi:hypothetical protein
MADSREHDPADALAAMTSGGGGDVVEERVGDDDMMAAPAPDASVFAPRRSTRDLVAERRLRNRRTLIPILLTCGVLMPAVGALKWLRGAESPFSAWPVWAPLALIGFGIVLLSLSIANMMQVRQLMQQTPSPPRETP